MMFPAPLTLQGFDVTVIAAGVPSGDALCQHTLK